MATAMPSLLRNRRLLFVAALAIFLLTSYSTLVNLHHITIPFAPAPPPPPPPPPPPQEEKSTPWKIPSKLDTESDRQIANGTLGFGAIYALGLSDRSDKRDGFELAASLTGLQVNWVDGVLGSEMNEKSTPPSHFDPKKGSLKKDGEIGCWRGHMNIIQKIVKSGVSSALVLEDDADWDLHIVQQMQQFALATNEFFATTPPWVRAHLPDTGSPYGENWDILWIGHCSGWQSYEDESNNWSLVRGDVTVPPAWDIVHQLRDHPDKKRPCSAHLGNDPLGKICNSPRLAPDERIIQQRTSPLCTTGYAVSAQGARKMLARMGGISVADVTMPIDWEMIKLCREELHPGVEAARCLTVSPPYIASHRTRGLKALDSDIQQTGGSNATREVAVTKGMVWSTRMNIENLIGGFEPESQYVLNADGSFRYRKKEEYRANQPAWS